MNKFLKGLAVGTLLIFIPITYAGFSYFSDVPDDAWYSDAVYSLAQKGIVEGYEDETYRPENNINRAEMAVMLDRLITYVESEKGPITILNDAVPIEITDKTFEEVKKDPFAIESQSGSDSINLIDDLLSIDVTYGGGCQDHEFKLFWDGDFEEDELKATLFLVHNANEDFCEAEIGKNLRFDLTPLKEAAQDNPVIDKTSIITLEILDYNGDGHEVVYVF